jgi:hypothetical protein
MFISRQIHLFEKRTFGCSTPEQMDVANMSGRCKESILRNIDIIL